jgi:hypothetical protein
MKWLQVTACALLVSLFAVTANADFTTDRGAIRDWRPQDIVITFGQDFGEHPPYKNVEQACLALTLAQFLRDPERNGGNQYVNVSIFVRNEGVKLADPEVVAAISAWQNKERNPGERKCKTPGGLYTLQENLYGFLSGGSNLDLVNCPICWCAYKQFPNPEVCAVDYINQEYPGTLSQEAIPMLLLGADKVIDF